MESARCGTRPYVSIVIKAYNEERHIAAAIESVLAALAEIEGEVILADGASTDATVAIARKYPIKIVRLDNPRERSCGAGWQLGYQYSSGAFVCVMDGDMRLRPGFLAAGVRFLECNPGAAGVGGGIVHHDVVNLEYLQRIRRYDADLVPGTVKRLAGCGLYRRSAIDQVGYMTDRNLHGGEELELAARLRSAGWTLARIDAPAVDHYCRTERPYRLLLCRVRNRNAFAPGELVRAVLGRAHFHSVIREDRNSQLCGLVAMWWITLAALLAHANIPAIGLAAAAVGLLPFSFMSLRWRSVRNGIYSVTVWNAQALCFLPGFLRRRRPPNQWIASTIVAGAPSTQTRKRAAIVTPRSAKLPV